MDRCPLGDGKRKVLSLPVRVEIDFRKYYRDAGPGILGKKLHPVGKKFFLDPAEIGKRESVEQGGAAEVRPEDMEGLGVDP
jgi:hypothetical protein